MEALNEAILGSAKEVSSLRKMGSGGERQGSERWNGETKQLMIKEGEKKKKRHTATIC